MSNAVLHFYKQNDIAKVEFHLLPVAFSTSVQRKSEEENSISANSQLLLRCKQKRIFSPKIVIKSQLLFLYYLKNIYSRFFTQENAGTCIFV
ncbi:hypothetical protein JCM18694_06210 [Prolixibacter denitrificans]|uniref:Uncharacterized protein n=1 Tax=Prolixibacter denitrificans TaxID=1541063 RepID=A0ABQ0ZG31_9BACT|nr:hypothetical protein JCM18694_06210 [Prolixibacter denitrificans]